MNAGVAQRHGWARGLPAGGGHGRGRQGRGRKKCLQRLGPRRIGVHMGYSGVGDSTHRELGKVQLLSVSSPSPYAPCTLLPRTPGLGVPSGRTDVAALLVPWFSERQLAHTLHGRRLRAKRSLLLHLWC